MTPDDERNTTRIDELHRIVSEINVKASRLHERVRATEDDVRESRDSLKEHAREVVNEVRRVGIECERKMVALDKKVEAESRARKEFETKLQQARERQETTLLQKVALAASITTPFLVAALTILSR